MTGEIACGVFAILSALTTVVTVAVKINKAIVLLESAVERLNLYVEEQKSDNIKLTERVLRLEQRVLSEEPQKSYRTLTRRVYNTNAERI